MDVFQSKYDILRGTTHNEVMRVAHREHDKVRKRNSRRQPYVRSQYFSRDKVFLGLFWTHLSQKRRGDRVRRARLYLCALDLMRNTQLAPETRVEKTQPHILLHRFAGRTRNGNLFMTQVKENRKTGRKDLVSCFPAAKQNK